MAEADRYQQRLVDLRDRVDYLAAHPRGMAYPEMVTFLGKIVKQSRQCASELEQVNRAGDAVAFYRVIPDAYRTVRKVAPRDERPALSEMADLWDSVVQSKQRKAMMSSRWQPPRQFQTAEAEPPDVWARTRQEPPPRQFTSTKRVVKRKPVKRGSFPKKY